MLNHQKHFLEHRMLLYVFYYAVLLVSFSLRETISQETKGQKADFSLKDTPGSFTVHATKILAKVSAQADSVNVVVKPGMAEYPLLQSPTVKPLVHVISPAIVRPQGGWNYYNLFGRKRSKIINKNTDIQKKTRKSSGTTELKNLPSSVHFSFAAKGKRYRKDMFGGSSGLRKGDYLGNSHIKLSDKRSVSERKMIFSGGTGQLNVHVDRNITKVVSSTGGVKLFIKNPWRTSGNRRSKVVH